VGLIARGIEEGGIPTIYIGSCRDMMALVKPPRAVFVDFPLGRQCGKSNDTALQMQILKDALGTLVKARDPGEIVDLPYEWGAPFDWESYERDLVAMLKEEGQPVPDWGPKK
jgi:D-proline reductase (dithiol) PrdB